MKKETNNKEHLTYEGHNFLRQRLALAQHSQRRLKITDIRSKSESPGLKNHEKCLLDLLYTITNGSSTTISDTGTTIWYKPGILIGGTVENVFQCDTERSIGYYLEFLFGLAPFCKKPLDITLKGITNGLTDPSVDYLKATSVPLLIKFGIRDEIELTVKQRGVAPSGGGLVRFFCPNVKKLRPVNMEEQGKVKKVRGLAFSVGCSPQMANRIVQSARSILNTYLPDVYIHTDHNKKGLSPGFGVTLVAETTEGRFFAAQACSPPKGSGKTADPEDLGLDAARMLLDEVCRGGCVDAVNQSLAALLMMAQEQNVVKTVVGPLTDHTIEFLRHARDFFGVTFRLKALANEGEEQGNKLGTSKVHLTCVGIGLSNIAKASV